MKTGRRRATSRLALCHGHSGEGIEHQPRLGASIETMSRQDVPVRQRLRENKGMQRVTGKMTDDEIAAVVDYVSTL